VLAGLLCAALAGTPILAAAQAPAAAPAAPVPDYHPSMGDLMTMAVQPRHIKLALAARHRNWTYAAYELSELRNALARVARTIPIYRNSDTAALVDAMTRVPLEAVDAAIHNRDAGAFNAAYARLTAACNACHQSQDHAMVVIRVPSGEAYSDQDFAPRQP
jgi:hypothetical protein